MRSVYFVSTGILICPKDYVRQLYPWLSRRLSCLSLVLKEILGIFHIYIMTLGRQISFRHSNHGVWLYAKCHSKILKTTGHTTHFINPLLGKTGFMMTFSNSLALPLVVTHTYGLDMGFFSQN